MKARQFLKERTAAAHDRVDALFARFDLGVHEDYRLFLEAQAEAHLAAEQALDAGLVREVVAADDLLPTAYALAHRFVDGRSPVATALMRQMLYRNSAEQDPVDAHRIESLAMFYASRGDGREGVAAFREKRPAEFTSRASTDLPPFYPW